jgi:hypothetical protein
LKHSQSVLDALADAEQLLVFLFSRHQPIDVSLRDARLNLLHAESCGGRAASEAPWFVSASFNARDAARAAFRAVPELRG